MIYSVVPNVGTRSSQQANKTLVNVRRAPQKVELFYNPFSLFKDPLYSQ